MNWATLSPRANKASCDKPPSFYAPELDTLVTVGDGHHSTYSQLGPQLLENVDGYKPQFIVYYDPGKLAWVG